MYPNKYANDSDLVVSCFGKVPVDVSHIFHTNAPVPLKQPLNEWVNELW